jgi:hypothetical protein
MVNVKCPMMGSVLKADKLTPTLVREFKGRKVGFCCAGCLAPWAKLSDAEKEAKLKASLPAAPKEACPAGCTKPCCASEKACPAGCTKPRCASEKACPPGCTKPCCASKKACPPGCTTPCCAPKGAAGPAGVVNTTCPLMGGKLKANLPPGLIGEHRGRKVGFCCAGCPKAWGKLPEAKKEALVEQMKAGK